LTKNLNYSKGLKMSELFDWVAVVVILQLMAILALVENDRACKNEPLSVKLSRRGGFFAGATTLVYAAMYHEWKSACLLMALACVGILAINIASIVGRNKPPLHGYRVLRRADVVNFWKRYP
jgi:hypothetical protein